MHGGVENVCPRTIALLVVPLGGDGQVQDDFRGVEEGLSGGARGVSLLAVLQHALRECDEVVQRGGAVVRECNEVVQ